MLGTRDYLAVRFLQRATSNGTRGNRVLGWFPKTRDIHTSFPAFCSVTETPCFNNSRPSWSGFEHPTFCMRCERRWGWANKCLYWRAVVCPFTTDCLHVGRFRTGVETINGLLFILTLIVYTCTFPSWIFFHFLVYCMASPSLSVCWYASNLAQHC